MKKILVTGGLGYIGSHTVVELQNSGYQVLIIDNLSNSSLDVLEGITNITKSAPTFERLDLRIKELSILRQVRLWAKAFKIHCFITKTI